MKSAARSLLLILLSSAPILASASGATPPPAKPAVVDLSELRLNPQSVKTALFADNFDVLKRLNGLNRSKLNYAMARSKLYPSLRLDLVAASFANPSFLIPAVQAMLPFLIPSNWFEAASSRRQFQSDQQAYRILQQDIYASVLSLYLSILRDQKLFLLLEQDLADWRDMHEAVEERHRFGLASDNELLIAENQVSLAELRLLESRQYLKAQQLELRRAIGLDPRRPIVLEDFQLAATPEENWPYEVILNSYWQRNPAPLQQLEKLLLSAKNERWSQIFAFFGGATLSANALEDQSYPRLATKNLSASASFTLSYSQVEAVRISNNSIESIKLMIRELQQETAFVIKNFVEQFDVVRERLRLAQKAEDSLRTNFQIQLDKYSLGTGASFQDVLNARIGMQKSIVTRIEAEREMDMSRILLNRMLELGLFAEFPTPP